MATFSRIFRVCFIITAIVYGINYWLATKTYLVRPIDLQRITKKYVGTNQNVQVVLASIEKDIRFKYKDHIIPKRDTQWIFVNSGGWMGAMYILHASLTEYILFFGTGVDTSGHSGRYWANITDTIVSGSFRQWKEGYLGSEMIKPGDTVVHAQGEATAVQWTAGTYMVEYGRGFIPSTLPFALADTVFGTTDFLTMYYTFRIYTKALINEAVIYYSKMFG